MLNKHSQHGFSMIEVLVTMIIMVVGLLGMASLQYTSLKNLNSTYFRYQAMLAAYDMAERMRGNGTAVQAGSYSAISVTAATGTECANGVCTTNAAIVANDIFEWAETVMNLPGGTGSVAGAGPYTITVSWFEQDTGSDRGTNSGTADAHSYVLLVNL